MNTAVEAGKRIFAKEEGSMRRRLALAAWIPLLAMLLVFAGWLLLTVLGFRSLVVLTGSMEPALSPGDVAIVDVIRPGDARPLDVVTFRDPSRSNQLVTHRVVSMTQVGNKLGFLTKGDRNTGTEEWTVDPNGTIGRLSFKVPVVGRMVVWFAGPGVRAMLLAAALIVVGGMAVRYVWRLGGPAPSTMPIAAVAIMGLLAGAVTVPATLAAFSSADDNAVNTFEAASSFGCADPGIRTVTASADTYVGESNPSVNHGTETNLYARTQAAANRRALATFDLPVQAGCQVTGALLGLYASSSQGTRTMEAGLAAAPWVETAVTWATQPATTGTPATRANVAGWNYWDVTSMVQSMYTGTSNYGFLVKDATEGAAVASEQIYNSREQATLRPTLYVSMAVNSTCVFPFGGGTSSGGASRDAWIAQDAPTQSNGNGDLYVQSDAGGANRRTLVTFNLPTITAGCSLFSATMRLHAKSSTGTRTLEVWRLAGAWAESGVTWNNQPATTGTPATAASGPGLVSWDVTQIVGAMYAGTNEGVLVKDATESEGTFTQIFASRTDNSNPKPELIVRWA